MTITRQDGNILIQVSDSVDIGAIQRLIDYLDVLETVSQNQGAEEEAAELAREVNKKWWAENKSRFLP